METVNPHLPTRPARYWKLVGFVGLFGIFLSLLVSGVFLGSEVTILDTDGWMRMSRIADLRTGAVDWWDGTAHRSNAPFGHSMHWTRPLDLLVIVLALPADLFIGTAEALRLAGYVVGPLTFGLLAAATSWAVLPLVGPVGAVVAGLGVAVQPALFTYSAAGRVDHHGLIFLAAVVLLGLGIRLALAPTETRVATWAGLVAGLGLWVSTEFLLPIAAFLVLFLVCWLARGAPTPAVMARFSVWWAGTTLGGLIVERAPDALSSRDLDRVSLLHLGVASLALAFWLFVGTRPDGGLRTRVWTSALAGALSGVTLWFVFPQFVAGPFGDVPPELWDAWLSKVVELQPLWPIGSEPTRTLYVATAPLLAIMIALAASRFDRHHRSLWLAMAALTVGFTVLGIAQTRFIAFAQLLATVGWGWLSATLVARIGDGPSPRDSVRRLAAMLVGVVGFFVPFLVVGALVAGDGADASPGANCGFDELVAILETRSDSPIVLTHVDWGPELLYRTDARVVAAPYHRNVEGIIDARRFLAEGPDVASDIARARGLDVVAVCAERDSAYLGADRPEGNMLDSLAAGEVPVWLKPYSTTSDLLLFDVELAALP